MEHLIKGEDKMFASKAENVRRALEKHKREEKLLIPEGIEIVDPDENKQDLKKNEEKNK